MEIDSYQTELTDYIIELENVLSPEVCKEIINEYENSQKWRSGLIGAKGAIDKNTRNCKVISISNTQVINENTDVRKELDSKIF